MTKYTQKSIEKANEYLIERGQVLGYGFDEDGEYETYEQIHYLDPEFIKTLYEASLLLEEEE